MLHIVPCGYCELFHVSKLPLFFPWEECCRLLLNTFSKAVQSKWILWNPLPTFFGVKLFPCLSAWKQLQELQRWIKHAIEQHCSARRALRWLWPLNDSLALHPLEAPNNESLSSYTQLGFLLADLKEICPVWNRGLQNILQQPNSSGWRQSDLLVLMPILFVYESYVQKSLKWNSC